MKWDGPVWLDTDIGTDVDDAIALSFAVKSGLDLRGVTVVSGDVDLRARVAKKLLHLLGRSDIPVARGLGNPLLQYERKYALGREGEGILTPGELVEGVEEQHGVLLMAERLCASVEKVAVVTVGSVANLALALSLRPEIREHISKVVIMGGCLKPLLWRDRELPQYFETNLNNDPEAAEIVLRSGLPIRLVPADITFHTILRKASVERIRAAGTPAMTALAAMTDVFHEFIKQFMPTLGFQPEEFDDVSVMLHDPLAVCTLVNTSFMTFEHVRIRLERREDGKLYTVPDAKGAITVEAVVQTDFAAFEAFLVETLLKG